MEVGRIILETAKPHPLCHLRKRGCQNALILLHCLSEQLSDPLDRLCIQVLFLCGQRSADSLLTDQLRLHIKYPLKGIDFKHLIADEDIMALFLRKFPEENKRIPAVGHDLVPARSAVDSRFPRHIEHQICFRPRINPDFFRQTLCLLSLDVDRLARIRFYFTVILLKISIRNIAALCPQKQNPRDIKRQVCHVFCFSDQIPDRPGFLLPLLINGLVALILKSCHLLASVLSTSQVNCAFAFRRRLA